jgi:lactoylglutathione lyase
MTMAVTPNRGIHAMRIEHVALWTEDLDRLVGFYQTYFDATVESEYTNPAKGFESRFLKLGPEARLEIMRTTRLSPVKLEPGVERMGLTHLAISVGSEAQVDGLTERLRQAGYPVLDGPRRTGDGYYESVVLDPDGNRLEITA